MLKRFTTLSAVVGFALAGCGGATTSTTPAVHAAGTAAQVRATRSATLTFNVTYAVCPGSDEAGTIDEGVQALGDIRAGDLSIPYLPQGAALGYKPPLPGQITNFTSHHTTESDSTTVQVNLQVSVASSCGGGG